MTSVFFTVCDSRLQKGLPNSRNLDFAGFVNSFKRFHPDIELVIFDEKDMKKHGVNFYNSKAIFGNLLSDGTNNVVNVDADHFFFDRCTEILEADYEVACPLNFNITDNLVGIKVTSGIHGEANKNWLIDEKMFLQGGLIASPSKQFWEHYQYACKYYDKFHCYENDILNLVAYLYPYKIKVLDDNCFYGCSIIGKEKNCYVENEKIMLEGKPVKAYHFAHGSAKKKYTDIFSKEVCNLIKSIIE